MSAESPSFVGRGGIKLRHALDTFVLDVTGLTCADFGANVGGFTDCLLKAGAARVYAVDTGYGTLAWTLRNDSRVTVMERTNALHTDPPHSDLGVPLLMDLVAIDLAWTPQRHAIPAALRWLKPEGRIVSLVKPHYELLPDERGLLTAGVLGKSDAERIAGRTADGLTALGVRVLGLTRSPIVGGASKKSRGNSEWLVLAAPQ